MLPLPKAFRAVRLIRLMRLLKLARVAKASRVLARYETKLSITYAQRDILKMAVLTVIVSHWMACIMGITDSWIRTDPYDADTVTWVTQCSKTIDIASVHDRYLVALYFAIYTYARAFACLILARAVVIGTRFHR